MEVIGIILFCLISIWLRVGSSWLIILNQNHINQTIYNKAEDEIRKRI